MKRATLEATDENILRSIQESRGTNRCVRIMEFIQTLDSIEENRFISLDARWGEGKTFYVRQIEKSLEYLTMNEFGTDDSNDKTESLASYFAGTAIEGITLNNSYLPVYYNALVKYYKLSRRDFLIYREKINSLDSCMIINDYSFEGTVASLFVPIIIILDMKNIEEKRRFINGESDFLKIMKMIPAGKNLYKHFVNDSSEISEEEKIEKGYARFKMVYDFLFADAEKDRELEINRNFKEKILECCGQMTLNSET